MSVNGVQDILQNIVTGGEPHILIKSQFTPEVRIDLGPYLLSVLPSSGASAQTITNTGGSLGNLLMRAIRPELTVSALGRTVSSYAPYGTPTNNMYLLLLTGFTGITFLGALTGWFICREVIPYKE